MAAKSDATLLRFEVRWTHVCDIITFPKAGNGRTMGLLIGADYVIASRNTFWVILNLILGSALVIYVILTLVGFISFFGDPIIPGLVWKAPIIFDVIVGNWFAVTMSSALLLPTIGLMAITSIAAVVELVLLAITFFGCVLGSLPCSGGDEFFIIFLSVVMLIYTLGAIYGLLSIISYTSAFNRYLKYIESSDAASELEFQTEREADL